MHAAHLSFFQNVAPKAGTPGPAQESVPSGGGGGAPGTSGGAQAAAPSPLSMLAPFLILLPFIWMMFRRQKKEQAERAKLKKGDKIATQAGLVGELMELGDQTSKLKIAAGVTVDVLTSSLQVFPTAPPKKEDVKADAKIAAEKK